MKRTSQPIIALTTDFGTRDAYVAAMKGVVLSLAPEARIIDITHEIEPQNVLHGAFVLWQVWPWYPPGTIHVAVVDPGVGTARRILLGKYGGRFFIGPDNGVVTFLQREVQLEEMYVVENRRYFLPTIATTFHGRDILAPVAAHLSLGITPKEFGRATTHIEMLPVERRARDTSEGLIGSVIHADRFGNLVTNIAAEQLGRFQCGDSAPEVYMNNEPIGPVRAAYAEVAIGEPIALFGSSGLLEIAVGRGSALLRFGAGGCVEVKLRRA